MCAFCCYKIRRQMLQEDAHKANAGDAHLQHLPGTELQEKKEPLAPTIVKLHTNVQTLFYTV